MSGDYETKNVEVDGRNYKLLLSLGQSAPADAVKLIVPSYQPNEQASKILRVCIDSIRKITPAGTYELWVVDNNSPWSNCSWLLDMEGINVVLSRTMPVPPEKRGLRSTLFPFMLKQENWGSYANALGLELALKLIDPESRYIMTLHMDTMPVISGWLSYLKSKLNDKTRVAGVCYERHRNPAGIVHVLGCLVDALEMKRLGLSYWPELPDFDVGDKITTGMRAAGYDTFACRNTYEVPGLADEIKESADLRALKVVRSLDDDGRVIFLHLGRGIPKADERYAGESASVEQWTSFAAGNLEDFKQED